MQGMPATGSPLSLSNPHKLDNCNLINHAEAAAERVAAIALNCSRQVSFLIAGDVIQEARICSKACPYNL
jgi:hypothetical protein